MIKELSNEQKSQLSLRNSEEQRRVISRDKETFRNEKYLTLATILEAFTLIMRDSTIEITMIECSRRVEHHCAIQVMNDDA